MQHAGFVKALEKTELVHEMEIVFLTSSVSNWPISQKSSKTII